jgi:Predicted membrane protein
MKTLGNIIWVVFGGIFIAIEYVLGSVALMITIIGIPFGLQSLKLAEVALWPFGKKVVRREKSSGCLSLLMNVIWFFVGGLPIVLTHLLFGLLFYITIIGIPFGNQHFKLMKLALTPFGREVVNTR